MQVIMREEVFFISWMKFIEVFVFTLWTCACIEVVSKCNFMAVHSIRLKIESALGKK